MHQGRPSHILSMPSMECPYALGPVATWCNMPSLKDDGKHFELTNVNVVEVNNCKIILIYFLDLVSFKPPKYSNPKMVKEDEEVDVRTNINGESTSCTWDCRGS